MRYGVNQMSRLVDMTGWKMWEHGVPDSRLEVIERYKINDAENKPQWICKCLCGNTIIARGKALKTGNTKSCGCYKKDKIIALGRARAKTELIGQKIGFLTILGDSGKRQGTNIVYKCLCDCGNICYINSGHLGRSANSCGCKHLSVGETNIKNFLINNNYNFIHDKIYFKDLISIKGYPCRYDFIILNEQQQPYWLIEFDGNQHKKESNIPSYYATSFEEIHANDLIKNQYAISHNIPLVRIPYSQRNNITEEILFSDKYLLKEFKT